MILSSEIRHCQNPLELTFTLCWLSTTESFYVFDWRFSGKII
jgi:hypothetical protein